MSVYRDTRAYKICMYVQYIYIYILHILWGAYHMLLNKLAIFWGVYHKWKNQRHQNILQKGVQFFDSSRLGQSVSHPVRNLRVAMNTM